jgi:hypothetical protein
MSSCSKSPVMAQSITVSEWARGRARNHGGVSKQLLQHVASMVNFLSENTITTKRRR